MKTPELTSERPAPGDDLQARLNVARGIEPLLLNINGVPPYSSGPKPIEPVFRHFGAALRAKVRP